MTAEIFSEAMQHSEPSPERDRKALVMLLREYQRIDREQIEQTAWFNAIRAIYVEDSDTREATQSSIEKAIEELAKELLPEDSKHVDVVGIARIQMHTEPAYLRVADKDALVEWAREHEHPELIERVPESFKPVTAAAKALAESTLAETGEVLAWAEQVPETTTMKIQGRTK